MSIIRFEQTSHQRRTQLLTWMGLAVGLALTGVSLTTTLVSRHYRAAESSDERQIASLAGQVALLRSGSSVASGKSSAVAAPRSREATMPGSSPSAAAAVEAQPRESRPVVTGTTGTEATPSAPVTVPTASRAFPVTAASAQPAAHAIRSNMAVRRVDLPDEGPPAANAHVLVQPEAAPTRAVSPSARPPVPVEKRPQAESPAREKVPAGETRAKELQRQAVSASSNYASSSASNAGDEQLAASASRDMPPVRATVSAPPTVEAVSQSQAQVADLSSAGVRMKSGLLISIGGKFPSGEKLIAVDPAKHQIVTDQRTIVLMP